MDKDFSIKHDCFYVCARSVCQQLLETLADGRAVVAPLAVWSFEKPGRLFCIELRRERTLYKPFGLEHHIDFGSAREIGKLFLEAVYCGRDCVQGTDCTYQFCQSIARTR